MAGNNSTDIIVKNLGGRPTVYTDELVKILEDIFKIGGTVKDACSTAGISKETYYNWVEGKEGFLTKMEQAQNYADIAAKNTIVSSIVRDKDVGTSKWWLEKRRPEEFGGGAAIASVAVQVNVASHLETKKEEYGI